MSKSGSYAEEHYPMELIPPRAMFEVSRAFHDGISQGKQDRHAYSWLNGGSAMSHFGAALRHMYRWLAGDNHDGAAGAHPLAHAIARLMMIIELWMNGRNDDRPTGLRTVSDEHRD